MENFTPAGHESDAKTKISYFFIYIIIFNYKMVTRSGKREHFADGLEIELTVWGGELTQILMGKN